MILHKLIKEDINTQLEDIKNHESTEYNNNVIFHCYWGNNIGFNQVISILSCYNTNIKNTNNKIILWVDSIENDNQLYGFISNYCEIRHFNHLTERIGTPLENYNLFLVNQLYTRLSFYSDYVRYILLSKYGGLYFDLDIFFYKKFDYLFSKYKNFVYTWEHGNHPNGAIYFVNKENKITVDKFINYFIQYGHGHFGFQDSFQTRGENQKYFNFESDIELNVLPCAWFDPIFLGGGDVLTDWFDASKGPVLFEDAYCFHWHNRNHLEIQINSPFYVAIKKLIKDLDLEKIIKID